MNHPSRTQTHGHSSQFVLLTERRFAPFFWTQFLGAGNDNMALYRASSFTTEDCGSMVEGVV